MTFEPLELPGVFLLRPEPHADDRGAFTRLFCAREMAAHGLAPVTAQASLSTNRRAGTVRAMHFQAAPHQEAKVVRVVRGAVFDAVTDLRRDSPTRGRSLWRELSAEDGAALYVPPGFAHGFQTLEDDTEVLYFISEFFRPGAGRGFRWDDADAAVPWPRPVSAISDKDRALPSLAEVLEEVPAEMPADGLAG